MTANGKKGLVPVQRLVSRKGKTFTQTVWIKPKYVDKVDKTKHVDIPEWDFKNAKEFDDEVKRINKLGDNSERKILKEHLLEHIENDLGIDYGKVSDSEKNAFARNCLKAFSKAKKYLEDNPAQPKPKATGDNPEPSQPLSNNAGNATLKVTKEPNAGKSDYIMDRPKSKELAKKVASEIGEGNLIESLKSVGITWNEVPEVGPNRMRALRALASFIRRGGEVAKVTAPTKDEPQLVIADKDKPLDDSKNTYEKDSIQYDYHNAPARHKLIGLATGILPTDKKSADYLEKLIKSGKIGVNIGVQNPYDIEDANNLSANEPGKLDVGLPKKLNEELNKFIGNAESVEDYNDSSKPELYQIKLNAKHFKGTPYEKGYNAYLKNREEFQEKYGANAYRLGVPGVETSLNVLSQFESLDSDWENKTGNEMLDKISDKLIDTTKKTDAEINKLWDELEIERFLDTSKKGERLSTFAHLINFSYSYGKSTELLTETVNKLSPGSKPSEIHDKIKLGVISKSEFIEVLGQEVKNSKSKFGSPYTVATNISTSWINGGTELLKDAVKKASNDGVQLDKKAFRSKLNNMLSDMASMKTPEAQHIEFNTSLMNKLNNISLTNGTIKMPEKLEPISIEDLNSNKTLEAIVKIHVGAMRKTGDKAKAKFLKDTADVGVIKVAEKEHGTLDVSEFSKALLSGESTAEINFPDADKIKHAIKTSLQSVNDSEAKKIEDKIQDSHSAIHSEFEQKVHGVYRIKRIASEEAYQNWTGSADTNGGKGETDFFYHGTSFGTAQKVLGESGGFKVFRSSDKIKVGSMLGYGVYLAKHSSKSALYVGDGYMSGNRGVMLLCKASLGNTVTATKKGFEYNQQYMDKKDVDTVFMDKPYVLNPEWAVKRAEQAVPRLWIDVERVYK